MDWIASYYVLSALTIISTFMYSDFQASCNDKPKSTERHLHALMC